MAPRQRAQGALGARWRRRSRSRVGARTSWRGRSASAGWSRLSGSAFAGSTGTRRYREGRALGAAVSWGGGVGAQRQPPLPAWDPRGTMASPEPPPPSVVVPLHGQGRPLNLGVLRPSAQR